MFISPGMLDSSISRFSKGGAGGIGINQIPRAEVTPPVNSMFGNGVSGFWGNFSNILSRDKSPFLNVTSPKMGSLFGEFNFPTQNFTPKDNSEPVFNPDNTPDQLFDSKAIGQAIKNPGSVPLTYTPEPPAPKPKENTLRGSLNSAFSGSGIAGGPSWRW
jgi:hypothetical protein